jgi:hypothetical protein
MELQKYNGSNVNAAEYRAKLSADIADKEARASRIQDNQSHFVSWLFKLCCNIEILIFVPYREKSQMNCERFTRKAPRKTWKGFSR